MKRHMCILRCHSPTGANPANAALALATMPNIGKYAALHGYDLRFICEPWANVKWNFDFMRAALREYEHVFQVGSDVVITNLGIKLESLLVPGKCLVVGAESLNPRTPLNMDTCLWTSGPNADALLDAWDGLREQFIHHEHFAQAALIHLYHQDYWKQHIAIAPPRAMQSHPWKNTATCWQPGDFAMHLIMLPNGDWGKYVAARTLVDWGEHTFFGEWRASPQG
jgi:hypothetical protein